MAACLAVKQLELCWRAISQRRVISGLVFCMAFCFVVPEKREARRHDNRGPWRFEHRESREGWDRSEPSNGRHRLARDRRALTLDSCLCTTAWTQKRAFRWDRSGRRRSAPGIRVAGADEGKGGATTDSEMQEPPDQVPHAGGFRCIPPGTDRMPVAVLESSLGAV